MSSKMEESNPSFINEKAIIDVTQKKSLTFPTIMTSRKELPRYMAPDYINSVLDRMPSGVNKMLCLFLWKTGVRITEAISITKRDVNINEGIIRIRWLKSRKYVERLIPMHPSLKDVLSFYIAPLNLEDRLFPISRQRSYQISKQWFKCNPHRFRNSFAVNWLKNNGNLAILSQYLGHSSSKETSIYLKLVPADQSQELNMISF